MDDISPIHCETGYGELGRNGDLGYEGKQVVVQGQAVRHALSAHGPSRIVFELNGRYGYFRCKVAINDDVLPYTPTAEFSVYADGLKLARLPHVTAGQLPQEIVISVQGTQRLELIVQPHVWDRSHAVWIEPHVGVEAVETILSVLIEDCLARTRITGLSSRPHAHRCIATVVTPGYAHLLDDMLGSLYANSGCQDALVVVCAIDADEHCVRVASKYGATIIPCVSQGERNPTIKSVLYSIAQIVEAEQYLCLDADMLILGDIRPIFSALEALPQCSILVCRDAGLMQPTLGEELCAYYRGRREDLTFLLGTPGNEDKYPLVVNDGLFAGSRSALLALDDALRKIQPQAVAWMDAVTDNCWRNQFLFNLALARLDAGVALDEIYNVQLHVRDVQWGDQNGGMEALWQGRPARILHFCGPGRQKYQEHRNRFAHIADPVAGRTHVDAYAHFLTSLRAWIGRHGKTSMAWSFYGTTGGHSANITDASVFPLLALLHYIIRSNGCERVLEAGTGRGVSTACLAAAVAHRSNPRVLTFDPFSDSRREDLWRSLPDEMRDCISARPVGSIEGMTVALEMGESYHAALLDSIHSAEQVWAEFELARQLVCPGGLILIHDVRFANGTVEQAVQRMEAAGYGVVRLWAAEGGAREDDCLGLAVIENRLRPQYVSSTN